MKKKYLIQGSDKNLLPQKEIKAFFLGIFLSIFSIGMLAQPANDCIFNATDLTAQINQINQTTTPFKCDSFTYSSVGSQPTKDIANGNSTSCDPGPDYRDIWFKFTVTPSTPKAWLDVYQATGSNDYVVALYSGTPGGTCGGTITGLTLIDCSDGASAGGPRDVAVCTTPIKPRLDISSLPSGTYYYRVWEWGGGVPPNGKINICAETSTPVGVTSDLCPGAATIAFGCGSSNVNVSATYPNLSNAGCMGNACNTNVNEPQAAAGGAGQIQNNCTGGWLTSVVYVNNVINNTAMYAFDVNSSGTCQANVLVKFNNITYGGTNGNVMQVQVMNAPCGGGANAVMAGTTSDPCFEMQSASGTLPNGTYYIVVDGQDGQLMKYDLSVDITYSGVGCTPTSTPPAPTAVNGSRCGTGSVNLSITGCSGTANWYSSATSTVSVNTGATYTTPSLTATTTYYVACTVGGCQGPRAPVTATINNVPSVTASATSPTLCAGQSTILTASGATAYSWSANAGSVTTNTASVTPPVGTTVYTVTGTTSGCAATNTVSVTVNALPTVTASAASPTICAGQSTTLSAGGATNYTWSANAGSVTTSTASVNPASTAVYTVTGNTAGCSATQTVSVNVTPLPTVTITASPASVCTGQSTVLSAGGATSYTWSANAGGSSATSVTLTPAATDTYTLTGIQNGCSNTGTVSVFVGSSLSITINSSVSPFCSGQTAVLTASGATTYTWDANAGSATTSTVSVSPNSNTTYSVIGDNAGCTGTQTFVLTVTPTPTVTVNASPASICSSQSTTLTASGATTYTWDANTGSVATSTVSVSPASNTIYTVTGDNSGCTATQTVSISVTPTPTVITSATPANICSGQSSTISASGATTYTWDANAGSATTPSVTVSPSSTIVYTVTGENPGCTSTQTISVNVTPTPTVAAVASSSVICSGQNSTLTASGATNYTWSSNAGSAGTSTVSVTPAVGTTIYTVTGNSSSCTNTATVSVTVNGLPNASATTSGTISCGPGSTVTVNASSTSSVSYSWSGPGIVSGANTASATVNAAGTYTVTVSDLSTACTNTATTTVSTGTAVPNASASTSNVIDCSSGSATINGSSTSSGVTYSWNGPGGMTSSSASATVTAAGIYTLTVTDPSSNCFSVTTTSVSIDTVHPDVTASTTGTIGCSGGAATVNANSTTSGVNYNWSGPGIVSGGNLNSANVNAAGTYSVTVTDPANGCSNTTTTNVMASTGVPNASAASSGTITCANSSANISGSSTTSGVTYSWSGPGGFTSSNANTIVSAAGTYTLTVTDPSNNCTSVTTTTIQTNTVVPNVSSAETGTITCTSSTATVTGSSTTSGVTYSWSGPGGFTSSNPNENISIAGTYTVTITDGNNGCTNTSTVVVPSDTVAPTADAGADVLIPQDGNTTLNATGGVSYTWSPSTGLSCTTCASPVASPTQTTNYCVTATGANGCTGTDCAKVSVEVECGEIFVPDAFSPNGDTHNDLECVYGNCIKSFQFVIYDRWGEKVFESTKSKPCWDGTFRGEHLNTAVFAYYLHAITTDGKDVIKKGNINLIR